MPRALILYLVAILLLGGCATSRTTQTTTPLVQTPDGGQIGLRVTEHSGTEVPGTGPLAIWKTPDGEQKVLITLVPAPGSPVGILRIEASSPHFSSDGNRCWLVRDGQAVASFDYVSGVAILGPVGQPDWAKPEQ